MLASAQAAIVVRAMRSILKPELIENALREPFKYRAHFPMNPQRLPRLAVHRSLPFLSLESGWRRHVGIQRAREMIDCFA